MVTVTGWGVDLIDIAIIIIVQDSNHKGGFGIATVPSTQNQLWERNLPWESDYIWSIKLDAWEWKGMDQEKVPSFC